ncbi:MAG TPA: metallophosphoesterase [Noviherbaspirillum sp.]|nr:metallophosphoesterase [Noviherbaspirillum sp.]
MAQQPLPNEILQATVNAFQAHKTVTAAAAALGIPRATFDSRMRSAKLAGLGPTSSDAPVVRPASHRVMHIPDLHCPFMHADAAAFIKACQEKFKPTVVVLAGDELDQHAISAHDADPNGYSPGHELTAGLKQLEQIYALFKEALVCESNHGQRPFKRAYKAGLPTQYLKTYAEFMEAPQGWVWADEFELDGVVYSHGESATGANGALQLAIRMGKSQAVGHWHGNAGASYFYNNTTLLFGLYSGCLIDADSYSFRYGKHFKLKPILGLSIIDAGVPTFVPMPLDSKKRWTGKV